MRRPSSVSDLWCPVGPRERIVCDDIKAKVALDSDANLVRTALYHYAVFVLGAGAVDTETFRLHGPQKRRRPFAVKTTQLPLVESA